MWHRFFKLVYGILLVGVIIFIPINFIINFSDSSYRFVEYKVRCKDNNQYVVRQGARLNDYSVTTKSFLNSNFFSDTRKEYNFYCKYYSEIQPYIVNYFETKDVAQANIDFFNFQKEKLIFTSTYPELFVLEKQYNKNFWIHTILEPTVVSLVTGIGLFTGLQILKNFYTYIKFGTWTIHPFHTEKKKKAQ